MSVGIKEWLDENSKSDYPLSKSIEIKGFITAAAFAQYDGFVPILKSVRVGDVKLDITIQFDTGDKVVELTKAEYFYGISKDIRDDGRRMGVITFGDGVNTLFNDRSNITLVYNVPFEASTVCNIALSAGVYSLQDTIKGSVDINTGDIKHIFFGIDGNDVIWNAVGLSDPLNFTPLKTINGVVPLENNIKIEDSTLIKIIPSFGGLTISLANSELNDSIAPVRKYA